MLCRSWCCFGAVQGQSNTFFRLRIKHEETVKNMKHDINNKFARICWNTEDWKFPTGEARHLETGNSYAQTNGFGHEEWLLRYEWTLSGYAENDDNSYRYSHLTPIGKFVDSYAGNEFSILLWTIDDKKRRYIVGQIDSAYVPLAPERRWAEQKFKKNGWLATMQQELTAVGIDPSNLDRAVVNLRFRQKDVKLFDPWIDVTDTNLIISKMGRYHPYDWSAEDVEVLDSLIDAAKITDPIRSEHKRTRKAVDQTSFDPRHIQLQNRLFKTLEQQFGKKAVRYENDFVDLSIRTSTGTTFIEIKTDALARRCIRHALGQVLEYSCYPQHNRATELLVVGDGEPTDKDKAYLKHLRKQHKLPIYYAQFFWDTNTLGQRY